MKHYNFDGDLAMNVRHQLNWGKLESSEYVLDKHLRHQLDHWETRPCERINVLAFRQRMIITESMPLVGKRQVIEDHLKKEKQKKSLLEPQKANSNQTN